jgi:hypothetical protein
MVVNLRGGLGNQALQISFALQNSDTVIVNDPYNIMHECFEDIVHLDKISSKFIWYTYAGLRKLLSPKNDPGYFSLFGIYDGYFHKSRFDFHQEVLEKVHKWCGCSEIEKSKTITAHFRGGDYLDAKARKLYEIVDLSKVLQEVNPDEWKVQIVSNDVESASRYLKDLPVDFLIMSSSLKGDLCLMINSSIFIGVNSTLSALVCAIRQNLRKGDSYLPSSWFLGLPTPELIHVKRY